MKAFVLFIVGAALILSSCGGLTDKPVDISEVTYKGVPHLLVSTEAADYYLEKQSGGFSSIIDEHGKDWIAFSKSDSVMAPQSAASDFRGLPNLVYSGEQNGIGHPGFDKCTSAVVNDSTILTISNNRNWEWTWTFSATTAMLHVIKSDTSRTYWFLYEGTPAGTFNPAEKIWGTNEGIRKEKPDFMGGGTIAGNWDWVFFGDRKAPNTFFVVNTVPDTLTDVMGFMGAGPEGIDSEDGMVVFGFGRSLDTKPLLRGESRFVIGFFPQRIQSDGHFVRLKERIGRITRSY